MAIAIGNTSRGNFAAGASTTIASAAAVLAAGNSNFVVVRAGSGVFTNIVTGIADTAGNRYYRIGRVGGGYGTFLLELWWAFNCTAQAANVVTATFGAAQSFREILVTDFSGLGTVPAIRSTDHRVETGSFVCTSGNNSSFAADSLSLACCQTNDETHTWTVPTGFTTAIEGNTQVSILAYKINSAQFTNSVFEFSCTDGNDKGMVVGIIEDGSGGAGGGGPLFMPFIGLVG